MARTSAGQMRSRALILVAVAVVLLVAVAVLLGRSTPSPTGIDEAAAERIASDFVVQGEASDTPVRAVVVERHEDHGTFWRVILHVDLSVPVQVGSSAVRSLQPMTFYYQIDVDKQTATPSLYAQG